MVDGFSTSGVNKAQLVGTHNERNIVPAYNWLFSLVNYFIKLLNIKNYHHLRFSKDEPGKASTLPPKTENGIFSEKLGSFASPDLKILWLHSHELSQVVSMTEEDKTALLRALSAYVINKHIK